MLGGQGVKQHHVMLVNVQVDCYYLVTLRKLPRQGLHHQQQQQLVSVSLQLPGMHVQLGGVQLHLLLAAMMTKVTQSLPCQHGGICCY